MNEDVTIKGTWWLPEKPDQVITGDITYGPTSGARLSLLGDFPHDKTPKQFTVWGKTAGGKPTTLFDCHNTRTQYYADGTRISEVSCYFGVVGGHFVTPAEMKFNKITADLSHLYEWVGASGISFTPRTSENTLHVTLIQLPDISFGSLGEFNAAIEFDSLLKQTGSTCVMSEECFLKLETKTPAPYETFADVIGKFQHFVALGVAHPVYVLSVKAYYDKNQCVTNDKNISEECEIIKKIFINDDPKESLNLGDVKYMFRDPLPDLSSCLKRYFDKHKLLKPVYDLYFSTVYNADMYLHQRFLALAHAIEAYHRVSVGGNYQSSDEYRNGLFNILCGALPKDLDKNFRASLKNKFEHLNEYSLRKRIRDICEKHVAVLSPFLGEPGRFAKSVADQRNSLTHRGSTNKNSPQETDWRQVLLMSKQLRLLLEVCLLHEIGFDTDYITKMLSRNRQAHIIRANKK